MNKKTEIIKSKRLKLIRGLMYLDTLLLMLSFLTLDIENFSWVESSGLCLRTLIFIGVFVVLFVLEKALTLYLRKNRDDE